MNRPMIPSFHILTLMSIAVTCACGVAERDQREAHDLESTACVELPIPVVVQLEGMNRTAACRLSTTALIALASDSASIGVLAGSSMRPEEFIVRRAPHLPVGSTGPATERVLVTIRLPQARWDADVWFSESLMPLAVTLVHKPM